MKLHPDALNQTVHERVFDTLSSLGHIPLDWNNDLVLRQIVGLPLGVVLEITSILSASLTPRGIQEWLTCPNSLFDDNTPLWMLNNDRFDAVKDAAISFYKNSVSVRLTQIDL